MSPVELPRRLVLTFTREGVEVRTLYRSKGGPNPGTARRRREVEALARSGLTAALEALDAGDALDLGTSGFQIREDVLHLPTSSPASEKPVKRGA